MGAKRVELVITFMIINSHPAWLRSTDFINESYAHLFRVYMTILCLIHEENLGPSHNVLYFVLLCHLCLEFIIYKNQI